jgi:hypothetical protein
VSTLPEALRAAADTGGAVTVAVLGAAFDTPKGLHVQYTDEGGQIVPGLIPAEEMGVRAGRGSL